MFTFLSCQLVKFEGDISGIFKRVIHIKPHNYTFFLVICSIEKLCEFLQEILEDIRNKFVP